MNVPEDLRLNELIKREDIPCFCKINNKFILTLDFDPYVLEGEMVDWDVERLNLLFPSGAGGEYTYYNHAMISIEKCAENQYEVRSLKFFKAYFGWMPIIIDGEYAPNPDYDKFF
ncbi:hypothetical protein ACTXGE_00130 [Psychrobacter sp. T6-4]